MHMHLLEPRKLLSVSLSNGTLSIIGNASDNKIVVSQGLKVYVILDNSFTSYTPASVSKISISTGAGRDNINLDKNLLIPASIYAGQGDDYVTCDSTATDYISGGADVDSLNYNNRSDNLKLSNDGVANDGATNEKDNIALDVETISGGTGNDVIDLRYNPIGTGHGGKGNDTIYGSQWGDLDGGPGDDQLIGTSGPNAFYGGDGYDWAFYSENSHSGKNLKITLDNVSNDGATGENDNVHDDIEAVVCNGGNDSVESSTSGALHVEGMLGNDTIVTHYGNDNIFGGGGNDSIDAGLGADTIGGGDGTDTLTYASRTIALSISMDSVANDGEVSHTVNGQQLPAENDNIANDIEKVLGGLGGDYFTGNSLANYFVGNGGMDNFNDAGGNDTCDGGDGNDYFQSGSGADSYIGGAGRDEITYQSSLVAVNVTLDGVANDGGTNEKDNVGADIEEVHGSKFADSLTGSSAANYLAGLDGNDTINGAGGDDTLNGGANADILLGGSGNDTATYTDDVANLKLSNDNVANDGAQGEGDNISSTVENIEGGMMNDLIIGNDQANILRGAAGDDTIVGGLGKDTIDGQYGNDTADYSARSANLKITLFGIGGNGEANENDYITACEGVIGGSGNDDLTTSSGSCSVDGGAGNDTITAYDGNDTIHGGAGEDVISAGKGDDSLFGDADKDSLFGGDGNDTISAGDGNDFIDGGTGNDSASGDGGDDQLLGKEGNDTLHGNDGKDSLEAGAGSDKMYGDAGNDMFWAQDSTKDTINGGGGVDSIVNKDGNDSVTSVP